MNPLVSHALRERRDLVRQLRDNPIFKKIAKIDELLVEYGEVLAPVFNAGELDEPRRESEPSPSTKDARAKAAAVSYVELVGRTHRKDLLSYLSSQGIMGHEKDPMQSLAIYLTRWKDEIVAVGEGYYDLRQKAGASISEPMEAP